MTSKWCLEELQRFLRASAQNIGTHLGTKSRVFKVLKTPFLDKTNPSRCEACSDTSSTTSPNPAGCASFIWNPSPEGRKALIGRGWMISPETLPTSSNRSRPLTVGRSISMSRRLAPQSISPSRHPISGRCATESDATSWSEGTAFCPSGACLQNAAEAVAVVDADLERSALSIHPLGARYGVRPEGDNQWNPAPAVRHGTGARGGQRLRAGDTGFREASSPPRIDKPDSLPTCRRRRRLAAASNCWSVSLEEVRTHVVDKLKPTTSVPLRPEPPPPGLSVYVIGHPQDFQAIQPVQDALNAEGFSVLLTARDGTEAEIQELHRDSLINCDAVIIFYGRAGDEWLRVKLLKMVKAPGWGRSRPLLARAVYVAAPSTPAKQAYTTTKPWCCRPANPSIERHSHHSPPA